MFLLCPGHWQVFVFVRASARDAVRVISKLRSVSLSGRIFRLKADVHCLQPTVRTLKICGGRPTQDPIRGSMGHLFKSVCFSSAYLLLALQPSSPPAFQPFASNLPTLLFHHLGLEGWRAGGLKAGGCWRVGKAGRLEGFNPGGLEGWEAGGLERRRLEDWEAGDCGAGVSRTRGGMCFKCLCLLFSFRVF